MRPRPLWCILTITAMHSTMAFLAPRTASYLARSAAAPGAHALGPSRCASQAAKRGVFYPSTGPEHSEDSHKRKDGQVRFVAWGQPQTLERHRLSGKHMYNPSMHLQLEMLECAKPFLPEKPLTGPLEATIIFRFQRPKTHYRSVKKMPVLKDDAPQFMTTRKDLDNLVKFVLDSLNGEAYEDDAQVVSVTAHKVFAENSCTEVVIRQLSPESFASLSGEPDVSTRSSELANPPKKQNPKPKRKRKNPAKKNSDSDSDSSSSSDSESDIDSDEDE